MKPITAKNAVDFLNQIHAADPSVLQSLITNLVPCNQAIADHPTIQVWGPEDIEEAPAENNYYRAYVKLNSQYGVGLLGILNGLFGTRSTGGGYIGAELDTDILTITRFVLIPDTEGTTDQNPTPQTAE